MRSHPANGCYHLAVKQSRAAWLLAIVVLIGAFLRGQDLLAPFENGHRGSCAAFFSLMASNHLRYGLSTTLGVAVLNPVKVPLESLVYYMHHPPGAIWIATLGANLGGSGPAALRMTFLPLSLGIILLVLRIARGRDMRIAAFAAGLVALMPITAYYGAFVNFEIPTLFFILLALHLFLRYQRRGREKDRVRFYMAQAAAMFCDWIAIGLPLMLLALSPLRARKEAAADAAPIRPFARIATLGVVASLVVVIAVKVLYVTQLSRFGQDPHGGDPTYYLLVTPLAPGFSWSNWAEAMHRNLSALMPGPLPWIAGIGFLIALSRAVRRKLGALDIAALSTGALGIANVVVLANHAAVHDYYLLYAAPAVAFCCAIVLRVVLTRLAGSQSRSPTNRLFEMAGLLALAALLLSSVRVLEQRRNFALSELGSEIAKNTNESSVVFVPANYTAQVSVRADRFVYGPVSSSKNFEETKAIALRFGLGGRPLVWLSGKDGIEKLDPGFREYLETNGKREERGPFVVYDLGTLTP